MISHTESMVLDLFWRKFHSSYNLECEFVREFYQTLFLCTITNVRIGGRCGL
ncbi:MAG: hypothetical protein J07HQW1_01284 [Haloquadratum walsbyi J07HQW1]|uniref:Uncharacterized protein n=1 Tax=Haloquadratum walsbyi J07HQW1 TaxID=1238424 RepID=U1N3X2_9EURY|nr:MAG: hypothetical protein J07HQW1_01284 [Haloquadratum walsbyi J07HQW1]